MKRYCHLIYVIVLSLLLDGIAYAQYPNIRISSVSSSDPNEVSISVNPVDGAFIAAGANLNYIYTSNDSGKTWVQLRGSSTLGMAGDPCFVYDGSGNLFYGHLSSPVGGGWLDRMVVQISTDNGANWNNGAGIGLNSPKQQDKEWIISDRTNSQFKNNLYISWTEFDRYGSSDPNDSTRILCSYSTDGGINWSNPSKVSDKGGDCRDEDKTVEGAVPAVGPNGEVYVAWSANNEILFDKSLDGGKTFGKDIFVANQPGGWDFAVSGIYRCNGLPVTLCDISNSPYRGNIYVVWSDTRNGASDPDVFISKSTDGGATWSETNRINDDNANRAQFFPWAAVDQSTGYIYVVFYDRRNYADNQTDVFLAVSKDGGNTFKNLKISDTPFIPDPSVFFGDYTCIAAENGNIYPIWMRMDDKSLSIWTARIKQNSVVAVEENENGKVPEGYELSQNYPNPFNPSTTISFSLPAASEVTLKIFDAGGREVDTIIKGKMTAGKHQINYDASKLSSGRYFYKLEAGGVILTKKMIYQK